MLRKHRIRRILCPSAPAPVLPLPVSRSDAPALPGPVRDRTFGLATRMGPGDSFFTSARKREDAARRAGIADLIYALSEPVEVAQ